MPDAARRAERLKAGLCASCGTREHLEDRTRCEECAQAAADAATERRELAARKGLCEACMTRKRAKDRTRCDPCASRYLLKQLERDREKRLRATRG